MSRYNPSDFDDFLPREPVVSVRATQFALPIQIKDGERNSTLFRFARSLRKRGLSPAAVLAATQAENLVRCDPPLDPREVEQIVANALALADRPLPPRHEARDDVARVEEPPAERDAAEETATPFEMPDATAALLADTAIYVRRFVVMTDHQATAAALWVAHSHTFLASEATPYVHVTAATKRAGKTLLLEVLEPVVANPWLTGRTSAAALPRKIDATKPTLLLDESDQALTEASDYSKALIGVLNSGYRKSGTTSLCVGEGTGLKVVDLKTYCPKAIAGIGKLPDTIADRCIVIKLRRRTREERVERARARTIHGAAKPLRQRLQAWAPAATRALLHASPVLPEPLDDRAQDVWEPLLAVAELAGGPWPTRARAAAVALSGGRQDEDSATLLLSDIRDVMDAAIVKDERGDAFDIVSSTTLLKELNGLEERPWPTWSKGHEMTLNALARLLSGFDVVSQQCWVAKRNVRGYRRAAFDDLFPRYLGIKPLGREGANETGPELPFSSREETAGPSTVKSEKTPITTGVPHGLATRTPVEGGSEAS